MIKSHQQKWKPPPTCKITGWCVCVCVCIFLLISSEKKHPKFSKPPTLQCQASAASSFHLPSQQPLLSLDAAVFLRVRCVFLRVPRVPARSAPFGPILGDVPIVKAPSWHCSNTSCHRRQQTPVFQNFPFWLKFLGWIFLFLECIIIGSNIMLLIM